jgi:hypothetical protein
MTVFLKGDCKMAEIGITIVRQNQDFDEDLVFFWERNEVFQGGIRLLLNKSHVKGIGKALSPFPDKIPGECSYSIGSKRSEDKSEYLMLRAYTADKQGHTALQINMNNKSDTPDEGECSFSIMAEPWAIHRLGELTLRFSDRKYRALNWSLNADEDVLVEWDPLPKGGGEPWWKEFLESPPRPGDAP